MSVETNQFHSPFRNISKQMSIGNFRQTANAHLNKFCLAYQDVENIRRVLNDPRSLLPSDCDTALETIERLQKSIQLFNSLLDASQYLPEPVISSRYSILFSLHYLDEVSYKLLLLLRTYREVCLDSSRETEHLHRQILRNLEAIMETGEKVEPASQALLK